MLLAGIGDIIIQQHVLSTDGVAGKSINELVVLVEKREMAINAVLRYRSVMAATIISDVARTSGSTFEQKKSVSSETLIPCPECGENFHPYRKLRNGWNKNNFRLLALWSQSDTG